VTYGRHKRGGLAKNKRLLQNRVDADADTVADDVDDMNSAQSDHDDEVDDDVNNTEQESSSDEEKQEQVVEEKVVKPRKTTGNSLYRLQLEQEAELSRKESVGGLFCSLFIVFEPSFVKISAGVSSRLGGRLCLMWKLKKRKRKVIKLVSVTTVSGLLALVKKMMRKRSVSCGVVVRYFLT
jgi:hypothetical protein